MWCDEMALCKLFSEFYRSLNAWCWETCVRSSQLPECSSLGLCSKGRVHWAWLPMKDQNLVILQDCLFEQPVTLSVNLVMPFGSSNYRQTFRLYSTSREGLQRRHLQSYWVSDGSWASSCVRLSTKYFPYWFQEFWSPKRPLTSLQTAVTDQPVLLAIWRIRALIAFRPSSRIFSHSREGCLPFDSALRLSSSSLSSSESSDISSKVGSRADNHREVAGIGAEVTLAGIIESAVLARVTETP